METLKVAMLHNLVLYYPYILLKCSVAPLHETVDVEVSCLGMSSLSEVMVQSVKCLRQEERCLFNSLAQEDTSERIKEASTETLQYIVDCMNILAENVTALLKVNYVPFV